MKVENVFINRVNYDITKNVGQAVLCFGIVNGEEVYDCCTDIDLDLKNLDQIEISETFKHEEENIKKEIYEALLSDVLDDISEIKKGREYYFYCDSYCSTIESNNEYVERLKKNNIMFEEEIAELKKQEIEIKRIEDFLSIEKNPHSFIRNLYDILIEEKENISLKIEEKKEYIFRNKEDIDYCQKENNETQKRIKLLENLAEKIQKELDKK